MWFGVIGHKLLDLSLDHVTDRSGWAQLRWFFVEKDFRGQGLGSQLLKRALSFSKRAGYEGVFLWTVSDLDSAEGISESWVQTGQRKEGCDWASWAREQPGNSGFFKPMRINHHSSPQAGSTQESYILKRFPGEPGLLSVCRPNDLNYIGRMSIETLFSCVCDSAGANGRI